MSHLAIEDKESATSVPSSLPTSVGKESATSVPSSLPTSAGRLDVTIPDEIYVAGEPGTVRMVIHNAFDVPVEILEIQGPKSTHLKDLADWSARHAAPGTAPQLGPRTAPQLASGAQSQGDAMEDLARKPSFWQKIKNTLSRTVGVVSVSGVSFAGFSADFSTPRKSIRIHAEKNASVDVKCESSLYDEISIIADEEADVKIIPDAGITDPETQRDPMQRIAPHCEAVRYFYVLTKGWLLFKPTRINLSTQITYRIQGDERTQVVSSSFEVKPPLTAVVMGAVLGALLGNLAKALRNAQAFDLKPFLISMGAATVMSLIATIALSRKSASQGFITVEDFFGGFVVGTLIGYEGPQVFDKAISPASGSTP
jgi:hypothetical protein